MGDSEVQPVSRLAPYVVILRVFTEGRMTATEFETVYLRLYLDDPTRWPDDLFGVLDGFFTEVDRYCENPVIREETGGIDDVELRAFALELLHQLIAFAGEALQA